MQAMANSKNPYETGLSQLADLEIDVECEDGVDPLHDLCLVLQAEYDGVGGAADPAQPLKRRQAHRVDGTWAWGSSITSSLLLEEEKLQ